MNDVMVAYEHKQLMYECCIKKAVQSVVILNLKKVKVGTH